MEIKCRVASSIYVCSENSASELHFTRHPTQPDSCCKSPRAFTSRLFYGLLTLRLFLYVSPVRSITVATVMLWALDRVRGRALGLLGSGSPKSQPHQALRAFIKSRAINSSEGGACCLQTQFAASLPIFPDGLTPSTLRTPAIVVLRLAQSGYVAGSVTNLAAVVVPPPSPCPLLSFCVLTCFFP